MDPQLKVTEDESETWTVCCCSLNKEPDAQAFVKTGEVGRPLAAPEDITDPKSTGRKRAAMIAPIFPGMLCEWAGLLNAGGGIHPIVGCRGNTIEETKVGEHAGHRHHGPDKNTLDNGPGNLHRICTTCHNRWHAVNNPSYPQPRPPADQPWYPEGEWAPHDPVTKATEEDYETSDAYWAKRKVDRVDTDD
jgi:hypothetical protein